MSAEEGAGRRGGTSAGRLASALLRWYRRHGRRLSFRGCSDPYHVLVSEIMLRKTTARQVDRVFAVFVERFPDVHSLASASVSEVESIIRPLGIKSRARALVEIAKIIAERYGGTVPDDYAELRALPSVGDYVAGCVVAFCYGRRVPLVDTNVERVLTRVLGLDGASRTDRVQRVREEYLHLAPRGAERCFHYALLDLAAALCRPRSPRCAECPIIEFCTYGKRYIAQI